jgi:hypothetical protein
VRRWALLFIFLCESALDQKALRAIGKRPMIGKKINLRANTASVVSRLVSATLFRFYSEEFASRLL